MCKATFSHVFVHGKLIDFEDGCFSQLVNSVRLVFMLEINKYEEKKLFDVKSAFAVLHLCMEPLRDFNHLPGVASH